MTDPNPDAGIYPPAGSTHDEAGNIVNPDGDVLEFAADDPDAHENPADGDPAPDLNADAADDYADVLANPGDDTTDDLDDTDE